MKPLTNQRFEFVDLARGLAALTVLIGHYRLFFSKTAGDWADAGQAGLPLYDVLWPIYEHTQAAVQLFWVISGFVFMAVYGRRPETPARTFVVHRIARLYPLHLATLLLVALVQFVGMRTNGEFQVYPLNDAKHFVLQLFLASNWLDRLAFSFNAPIWSVSLEVLVYAVFFLTLRVKPPIAKNVAAFLFFFVWERMSLAPLAWCAALFFEGAITFQIVEWLNERKPRLLFPLALAGFLGSIALTIVVVRAGLINFPETALAYAVYPSFIALLASFDLKQVKVWSLVSWLAPLTYSLYLCHMPIVITLKTIWPEAGAYRGAFSSPFTLLAYVVGVIMVAWFVTWRFEMPMQKWIRGKFAPSAPRSFGAQVSPQPQLRARQEAES